MMDCKCASMSMSKDLKLKTKDNSLKVNLKQF